MSRKPIVYILGDYYAEDAVRAIRIALEDIHGVTTRVASIDHEINSPENIRRNLVSIYGSDAVIVYTEPHGFAIPASTAFEIGYALGLSEPPIRMPVYRIGTRLDRLIKQGFASLSVFTSELPNMKFTAIPRGLPEEVEDFVVR